MPDTSGTPSPSGPGTTTSEFQLSVAVAVFGAIISGLTVTLGVLHADFPEVGWIGLIAGALTTIAPVLSYIKSRGTVKSAEAIAAAAPTVTKNE